LSGVKILAIANHVGARGGLERTQLTTCRELAARGHTVDLIYVSAGDFTEDWREFAGAMVSTSGTLPRRSAPITSTLGVLRAVLAARRLRPDVLYVYRYWDLPYATIVSRLFDAPIVFHLCLPVPAHLPRWLRPSLKSVNSTLAVSKDTASRWVGTGLRDDRITVVITGIDTDRFSPADEAARLATRRELGLPPESLLLLYTGRIDREKGVDVLVKACHLAAVDIANLHLIVAGGPSLGADPRDSERYAAELREIAGDLPVTWLGPQKDVVPLIQTADLAVVPSLWPEPLPRAILEPLACGVPVVASKTGGNPEILCGWLSEYLVDPGDEVAFAASITSTVDWRLRDPELGLRCRHEAEERLTLERETDLVESELRAAVDQGLRKR